MTQKPLSSSNGSFEASVATDWEETQPTQAQLLNTQMARRYRSPQWRIRSGLRLCDSQSAVNYS